MFVCFWFLFLVFVFVLFCFFVTSTRSVSFHSMCNDYLLLHYTKWIAYELVQWLLALYYQENRPEEPCLGRWILIMFNQIIHTHSENLFKAAFRYSSTIDPCGNHENMRPHHKVRAKKKKNEKGNEIGHSSCYLSNN